MASLDEVTLFSHSLKFSSSVILGDAEVLDLLLCNLCGEELDWHTFTLSFEMQILFSCSSDKCFWLTVCFSSPC